MEEKKCGTCSHWRKQVDPSNIANIQGLCVEGPPCVSAIQQSPGRIALMSNYPTLPADFQACDRHQQKIEVIT